jgi:hypothetical protein
MRRLDLMRSDHSWPTQDESSSEGYSNDKISMRKTSTISPLQQNGNVAMYLHSLRDFPPIPRMHNPCVSVERRHEIAAHISCMAEKYAEMEENEIRLLKAGAL